jgi:hypothetical protein
MPDLGAIGNNGSLTKRTIVGFPVILPTGLAWSGSGTKSDPLFGIPAKRLQSLMIGDRAYVWGGEDFIQGNPAQPSLRMDAKGDWRFRWALAVGQHTISVNVMQAVNLNPRPSLEIKANPAIGIASDIEVFAGPSTTWTSILANVTTTAIGATWVELRCNLDTNVGFSPAYFDHVVKT